MSSLDDTSSAPEPGSNPFATRYIRPGAIPYLFPVDVSAETLLANLNDSHWLGAIIGPHGTGKSSLLASLLPLAESQGRRVVTIPLHDGQRTVPWRDLRLQEWDEDTLVVVDGYEQLSGWQRLLLRARIYQRRAGLLVTAHKPLGLPTVYTTGTSLELAERIVAQLVPPSDARVTTADIATAYMQEQGNLREMLFRLYDVFRSRSSL
jgi:hypothetical protein